MLSPGTDSTPSVIYGFIFCSASIGNSYEEGADCPTARVFQAVLKIGYWKSKTTGLPEHSTETSISVS